MNISDEDYESLIGPMPKRAYVATNQCPHIKRDGEQCRAGVMAGKDRCSTHSGLRAPNVAAKHNEDKIMQSPEVASLLLAEFRKDGEVTDPAEVLRRVAGALERVAHHFAQKIGDGTEDIDPEELRTWTVLVDRLTRLCVDLAKLGLFDKALDASEIVFRREYQELSAQIIDDLEDFPEARQALAERMTQREAERAGI